jgi:hypothetical protein
MKLAPFFTPKKPQLPVATELVYRAFLNGNEDPEGHPVATQAEATASQRRFFHWFLEFAEVMQAGGFDCFLGNPPFLGGQRLSGSFGKDYLEYLKTAYAPAGSIDLVGYFVRRNYDLLKPERALGTLATNTIAQGGTREGSLQVIEESGGSIVMAVRSRPWPGAAAVEVSLAAIYKGAWQGKKLLDGKPVPYISTYFDDQLSIGNPYPLAANADKSFQGSIVLGQGFVLTTEEAQALIARNPKNKDVLYPYLNGEDLNSRSDQSPSRWVINFKDWPLDRDSAPTGYDGTVAADYPDCLDIVEQLVKPVRAGDNRLQYRQYWWHYAEKRGKLYRTIEPLERVMVFATQATKYPNFSFTNKEIVSSNAIGVVCSHYYDQYLILNSNIHENWAWKNASTMRGDLRYAPSDIFNTFPFPPGFEPNQDLRDAVALCVNFSSQAPHQDIEAQRKVLDELGRALDEGRKAIMTGLDIGLTKLYNLYHTPQLSEAVVSKEAKCDAAKAAWALPLIVELRELHRRIDEAVRDAYGWNDLPLQHGFHELEFLPENDRVRYTVSNSARKIILTELLKLNHQRHGEEVELGLVDEGGKVIRRKVTEQKSAGARKRDVSGGMQDELF